MKLVLKQCVLLLFSGSLLACTTPGEPSAEAALAEDRGGRDCISHSGIRDYQVLDEANLIVTAGVSRKYHVTLTRQAFGLRSTWRIGFQAVGGMVCPMRADLVVYDSFTGPERIRVRTIRQIDPDEHEDLLVRFGKKEPVDEQAPAEEEVKGAEVEELD